jgi:NADPH:quinone reductase
MNQTMNKTVNQSMQVVQHGAGGPPSCLVIGQTTIPTPLPDEVLIKVAYAGVNRPDCLQRSGSYPPPLGASAFIGLEASGVVQAVGAQVTDWKVGDRVCALTNGGAYAEYVCAAQGQVLPIPDGLSFLQAAALPENYFTVFVNVFMRGQLSAGESILVHGGSSGIGLTAIQLARAFGATVFCTVGSDDKAQACIKAGAHAAINYREQDFVTRIGELTDKQGVNMVLDMVGGEYTDRNLKCLGQLGRLVQIAFLQGAKASIDMSPIMLKRLSFTGSTLRPRTSQEKQAIAIELKNKVWPLLSQNKALPVIHQVFPIDQAAQAHALMESSTHIGKIMLSVQPDL